MERMIRAVYKKTIKRSILTVSSFIIMTFNAVSALAAEAPPVHTADGSMGISANTSQGLVIASESPADAVLAQTSYFARVLIQANDVYPPSHVSSRNSGEIYASTIKPVDYNLKMLSDTSIYRNAMGAVRTSAQNTVPTNKALVIRDWVEFHINKYCDPLAANIGLNNCGADLASVPSDAISQAKVNGQTSWDLVPLVGTGRGPFAADVNASTLFSREVNDPEAAMRYVYNVTNVLPGTMTEEGYYTIPNSLFHVKDGKKILTEEGYQQYLAYIEYQSKSSLNQYAFMKILSERMRLSNVKIPVNTWDEAGNKTTTQQSTSRHGLLEFEANKRFKDPNWYDRVQQMPTPALLKEIAYMMAMQLSLEFKRYELQQIQTALMASSGYGGQSSAVSKGTIASNGQSAADALGDLVSQGQQQGQQAQEDAQNNIGIGSGYMEDVYNQLLAGF